MDKDNDVVMLLINDIAIELTGDPDSFVLEKIKDDNGTLYLIKPSTRQAASRLIGSKGNTVEAIRTIVRNIGYRENNKYGVKVESSK